MKVKVNKEKAQICLDGEILCGACFEDMITSGNLEASNYFESEAGDQAIEAECGLCYETVRVTSNEAEHNVFHLDGDDRAYHKDKQTY